MFLNTELYADVKLEENSDNVHMYIEFSFFNLLTIIMNEQKIGFPNSGSFYIFLVFWSFGLGAQMRYGNHFFKHYWAHCVLITIRPDLWKSEKFEVSVYTHICTYIITFYAVMTEDTLYRVDVYLSKVNTGLAKQMRE